MAKDMKPSDSKISPDQITNTAKKDDAELSEAELKKVSGGPTAVEKPARLTN